VALEGDEATNLLDATEYYNLDELKNTKPTPIVIPKDSKNDPTALDLDTSNVKNKTGGGGSLDFLTSIFKRSSQSRSASRSKSPPPQQPQQSQQQQQPISVLKSSSPIRSQSPLKSNTRALPEFSTPAFTGIGSGSNIDGSTVQNLIHSELKRIMQLQHDTVMGFLNGGVPNTGNNLKFIEVKLLLKF
jgi:hypothetical protein